MILNLICAIKSPSQFSIISATIMHSSMRSLNAHKCTQKTRLNSDSCNYIVRFYFWVRYACIIGKLYTHHLSMCSLISFLVSITITVPFPISLRVYTRNSKEIIIYCALHKQNNIFSLSYLNPSLD